MSSTRTFNELTPSLEEKIRVRAYEIFEKRGYQHGRALDDWLQAEAELLQSKMGNLPTRTTTFRRPRARRNGN